MLVSNMQLQLAHFLIYDAELQAPQAKGTDIRTQPLTPPDDDHLQSPKRYLSRVPRSYPQQHHIAIPYISTPLYPPHHPHFRQLKFPQKYRPFLFVDPPSLPKRCPIAGMGSKSDYII
jgi:hypothetical protein